MQLFHLFSAPWILAVCLTHIFTSSQITTQRDGQLLPESAPQDPQSTSLPNLAHHVADRYIWDSKVRGASPPRNIQKRTPPHPLAGFQLPQGWTTIYTVSTAFMPIRAASTALLSLYSGAYTKAVLWTIRSYEPDAKRMVVILGRLQLTFVASRGVPDFSVFVAAFAQRMMAQTIAGFTGRYWIEFLAPPDAKGDRLRMQVVLSVIGDVARNIGVAP